MKLGRLAVIQAIILVGASVAAYLAFNALRELLGLNWPANGTFALVVDGVTLALAVLCIPALLFVWLRLREAGAHTRRTREALATVGRRDALTGLMNRPSFEDVASQMIECTRAGGSVALLVLDLKGFKPVNELFGEDAADELLQAFTRRLKSLLDSHVAACRTRGDVFCLALSTADTRTDASDLAHTIIKQMQEPLRAANAEHLIGVAIGMAMVPNDADNIGQLMLRAGRATRTARSRGHWGLAWFEPAMESEVADYIRIERDLPLAIGTDAIEPHYQPIVELATGRIARFEALARWTHPVLGRVPPTAFVAVAENSGLIRPFTDFLFRKACRDAAQWPEQVGLSFNVSAKELQDASTGAALLEIMAQEGLAPSRLQVEITESALVQDIQAAREVLRMLSEAGATVALDDFGTGHASLTHLRELKIDALKIDKSFVQRNSAENVMILEVIIAICERMGLQATAEGIETPAQRDNLVGNRCAFGQGYLFGRPMPAQDVLELLTPHESGADAVRRGVIWA
jgi:diguanylate cyclase (GGDEF)-like protein